MNFENLNSDWQDSLPGQGIEVVHGNIFNIFNMPIFCHTTFYHTVDGFIVQMINVFIPSMGRCMARPW